MAERLVNFFKIAQARSRNTVTNIRQRRPFGGIVELAHREEGTAGQPEMSGLVKLIESEGIHSAIAKQLSSISAKPFTKLFKAFLGEYRLLG